MKYKAFGKVKIKKKEASDGKIEDLLSEKSKVLSSKTKSPSEKTIKADHIDIQIAQELKSRQRKEIEKEVEGLKSLKETKGNAAAVFRLKGKIVGKKRDPDEPSAVIDPKTKKLAFKPSEIFSLTENQERILKRICSGNEWCTR